MPGSVRAAFEFRHESWFSRRHVGHAARAQHRTLRRRNGRARHSRVVTADYAYYRYRTPSYTAEERERMVARIREHLAAGRDVFAYFKHEETPEGALYAVELLRAGGDATAASRLAETY